MKRRIKHLAFISGATARKKVLIKGLPEFLTIGTNVGQKGINRNGLLEHVPADNMAAIQEAKADSQYCGVPVINEDLRKNKREGYWQFQISDNGIEIERQGRLRISIAW